MMTFAIADDKCTPKATRPSPMHALFGRHRAALAVSVDLPEMTLPTRMSTLKNKLRRGLIFGFVGLTPLLMIALWSTSIVAALALFALAHAVILLPIFLPRLDWLGPVITHFEPAPDETAHRNKPDEQKKEEKEKEKGKGKKVWLTIDDGPDPGDSFVILDLLDRYRARATFFVKGELAEAHPELIREIQSRGHRIANHSHTHPTAFFWCAAPATVERELRACNAAITAAGSERPVLFRAPVGIKSPALHPVLRRLGMRLCAWSIRAYDGVSGFDPTAVETRVIQQLRPGAILCMHQGVRDRSGTPLSPVGIARVLEALERRGYRCVIPDLDHLR